VTHSESKHDLQGSALVFNDVSLHPKVEEQICCNRKIIAISKDTLKLKGALKKCVATSQSSEIIQYVTSFS
jgi:hypothetical protein